MSDTKAFDPSTLQPGDEVGIELCCRGTWGPWSEGRVVAVGDGGLIELENGDCYGPSGDEIGSRGSLRLAAPTDEGRRLVLQETVATDLDILKTQTRSMDLATLRRLKAWIDAKGWDDE